MDLGLGELHEVAVLMRLMGRRWERRLDSQALWGAEGTDPSRPGRTPERRVAGVRDRRMTGR